MNKAQQRFESGMKRVLKVSPAELRERIEKAKKPRVVRISPFVSQSIAEGLRNVTQILDEHYRKQEAFLKKYVADERQRRDAQGQK